MMDLHEWFTFANTTRTRQGAEGPPRELPTLPRFHIEISLPSSRDARELCGGTSLPHKKKENCPSRPRPNLSKTSKRPTSSEEATSILASTMIYVEKGITCPLFVLVNLFERKMVSVKSLVDRCRHPGLRRE